MSGIPSNFPHYDDVKEVHPSSVPPFEIVPPEKPAKSATQRKGTKWIHPNLPQLPMTLIILGPRNRGKSVALRNMLDPKKKGSYGHAMHNDNIVIYSATKEYDDTLTSLGFKNVYGPPDTVPDIIQDIYKSQEQYREEENMADVMLVIEDCTVVPDAWNILSYLGFSGRHRGLHTIAVCHKLTSINRNIRTQQQQWMIFKPHEESERESILDAFASKGPSRDIWRKALYRAWKIPYNFVYVDFERGGEIEHVYRSGFNDPLFTPEEIATLEYMEEHGEVVRVKPGDVELDSDKYLGDSSSSSVAPQQKRKRGRPRKHKEQDTKRRRIS